MDSGLSIYVFTGFGTVAVMITSSTAGEISVAFRFAFTKGLEIANSKIFDTRYIIEETKTEAGKRKIPITEDVAQMFQAIIEDREPPKLEKVIDSYTGFLFYDDDGNPLVAMHWQHRFNRMVGRYNDIYRVQMPNITPHVCRHTYCSNMAKSGMNPKTLQNLILNWKKDMRFLSKLSSNHARFLLHFYYVCCTHLAKFC